MKTEKMSLLKMKNSLSRDEMKRIMAGSAEGGLNKCCPSYGNGTIQCSECTSGTVCTVGTLVAC